MSLFDPLVLVVVVATGVVGLIQGGVRSLLGLGSIVFSFLLAANLRDWVGGFLASNWTHLPVAYSYMVAFGVLFLVLAIGFSLLLQAFYRRVVLVQRHRAVDPVLGFGFGLLQGAVLVGVGIVILDSYFRAGGLAQPSELPLLRELYLAAGPSSAGAFYRDTLIPAFLTVAGPLFPASIGALYPRA
jgi:uncharacterized membrane protein required for colicin V production